MILNDKSRPTIALLMNSFYASYDYQIWLSILDRARESNVNLVTFTGSTINSPSYNHIYKNLICNLIEKKNIDGIISSSSAIGNFISLSQLEEYFMKYSDMPFVSIGIKIKDKTSILIDNEKGMYEGIIHLIETHNSRNIAFIKGLEYNPEAISRFNAYIHTLKKYNLPFKEEFVVQGDFLGRSGTEAVKILLDQRKIVFDAIVGSNDHMAIYAMKELQKRGYKIPEDIAIVGFDDIKESQSIDPSLTTIRQPYQEIGQKSVDSLLSLINGDKKEDIILSPKLIVRPSCGCNTSIYHEDKIIFNFSKNSNKNNLINNLTCIDEENYNILFTINREILGTFDINQIKEILINELPNLNIKSCYICLYNDKDLKQAKVLFQYNADKNIKKFKPEPFPSNLLIPGGLKRVKDKFGYLLFPLVFKDEILGFILFEESFINCSIYEIFSNQLSGIIKSAFLMEEIQSYSESLEIKVIERTLKLEKAQRRLEKSERRFREMAENLPVAIIENNPENNILYLNTYAKQLLNISIKDNLLDFIEPAINNKFINKIKKIQKNGNVELCECKLKSRNGNKISALIKSKMIYDQDKPKYIRSTIMEIEPNYNILLMPSKEFCMKYNITERETEIIILLIKGLSYSQIGKKLFISYKTVDNHISNIYRKANVNNRNQLVELIQKN